MENKRFYYLYKITNNINNHFYYGIHCTNNLDDNYMGSGKILYQAYEKYGIENFTKEIIKFCNSLKEVSDLEREIVNEEMINNPNCYNIILGGYFISEEQLKQIGEFNSKNQTGKNNSQFGKCWIYKGNKSLFINKNELDKYLSDGWIKGRKINNLSNIIKANKKPKVWVHKGNNIHMIYKEDLDLYLKNGYKRGKTSHYENRYIHHPAEHPSMYKKVSVRDINNNIFTVSTDDPRYLSGELVAANKGKISAKDKNGNKYFIFKNDPRLKSGELYQITFKSPNMKNRIIVKDKDGNKLCVSTDDPRYLSGELVGINKGKHWKQKKRKH